LESRPELVLTGTSSLVLSFRTLRMDAGVFEIAVYATVRHI